MIEVRKEASKKLMRKRTSIKTLNYQLYSVMDYIKVDNNASFQDMRKPTMLHRNETPRAHKQNVRYLGNDYISFQCGRPTNTDFLYRKLSVQICSAHEI